MQYTGQIVDGQMHGSGRMEYENGEVYEGQWEHGKRHGYAHLHALPRAA